MQRGRMASLASQIGAHAPDISRWATCTRPVPVERCLAIEKATNGEVSRIDLRPDDWHKIWPDFDKNSLKINTTNGS